MLSRLRMSMRTAHEYSKLVLPFIFEVVVIYDIPLGASDLN